MLCFCTLFHANYAAKGLTLYRSLSKVCPEFRLFVFAFDDEAAEIMKTLALPEVTIITLSEFEAPELLRVKPSRSIAEYCWTCTASTIIYCLNHFEIDHCTYLDSDLFFYQNPQVMIDEMGDNDILITPHWFAPDKDNSEEVGHFCVQFVSVKNTTNARNIITEWRNECIDWCFSQHQDGKFGDQKYLDKWPSVHTGICVSTNMGGGVAPWNMDRYSFRMNKDKLFVTERRMHCTFPVIFCHFHFVFASVKGVFHKFSFDKYAIEKDCSKAVFIPYCHALRDSYRALNKLGYSDKKLGLAMDDIPWRVLFRQLLKRVKRSDLTHYWWI